MCCPQSWQVQTALARAGIPFHVFGGGMFWERADVKDVLALLRLVARPHDTAALTRVLGSAPLGGLTKGLGTVASDLH